ncbi:membrane or secreted protein [Pseudalgibacter alginicilyticus]|uniref:Membrane or secreted protein n=1 Tax=Pseudalgibacter alginicilyticus TaxID=1736674 RepID=A0A0P0D4Y1_9FLAO|nr:hypothetical protein [Pseudalgibacter alginicilyticus]ALJ05225.1 membrane or secreted protein [Pseudalgibacter alginicilyticus]
MKKILLFLTCLYFSIGMQAQSLIGAWESLHISKNNTPLKSIIIFTDGYHATSTYNSKTGEFISTSGGSWKLKENILTGKIEFSTNTPELIGKELNLKITLNNSEMEIVDSDITYKKIDDGTPGKLKGAWLMSGRVRNGETQLRNTSGPRKTMKILSGTRFQWIAYNTETKQFMGTGGGTYTTIDGTYTENIEFFSKDDSRVGASLKFDFKLDKGDWHHSGFSSKGDPLHEIWSLRK